MTHDQPQLILDLSAVTGDVPRLHDYFGAWAVEPSRFWAAVDRVRTMDLQGHIAMNRDREPQLRSAMIVPGVTNGERGDNIAIIQASGTLMKVTSSLEQSTSTVHLRRQIRQAASDPAIGGIILAIDSPGGTSAGTSDLAAEVRRAAAVKPVWAYVEDLAASAAYWVASQADRIDANSTNALIGSIGTIIGLWDTSKKAEKDGIEAVVMATGDLKGTGFPGAPITAKQRAYLQALVDDIEVEFEQAVASGRNLSSEHVHTLATGEVYPATRALNEKLIDGIRSLDEVVAAMRTEITRRAQGGPRQSKEIPVDKTTNAANPLSTNNLPAPLADATPPSTPLSASAGGTASPPEVKAPDVVTPAPASDAATPTPAADAPATLAELKQHFPDASADFREKCQEQGLTLAGATALHATELKAQLDAERAKTAELQQVLGERRADRGGDEPMPVQGQGGEEPTGKQSLTPIARAITSCIRIAGR